VRLGSNRGEALPASQSPRIPKQENERKSVKERAHDFICRSGEFVCQVSLKWNIDHGG